MLFYSSLQSRIYLFMPSQRNDTLEKQRTDFAGISNALRTSILLPTTFAFSEILPILILTRARSPGVVTLSVQRGSWEFAMCSIVPLLRGSWQRTNFILLRRHLGRGRKLVVKRMYLPGECEEGGGGVTREAQENNLKGRAAFVVERRVEETSFWVRRDLLSSVFKLPMIIYSRILSRNRSLSSQSHSGDCLWANCRTPVNSSDGIEDYASRESGTFIITKDYFGFILYSAITTPGKLARVYRRKIHKN